MSLTPEQIRKVLDEADCCYTQQQVEAALDKMAALLKADFHDKFPLLICVMTGGLITLGQLLMRMHFPLQYDYLHASRYRGETSGGRLKWLAKNTLPIEGRHVLLVDDILDEGITLQALVEHCKAEGASSVHSIVLVDKQHTRKYGNPADYVGLQIEDRYVFGYGMDYKGYLRNAPGIYAVKGL